ncbi:PQQ-dependent sugar dehydrogenase [Saccharomonospora saliphila]|uniref:PQQ-dependent sugar dehydrogenase n=1 Tax=Saccharomonospora saliphila TaxID=369829 RepID=UPI000370FD91|nr:PQQ-dependent sugar dehydrogenase [Saccharomonospora saliphila]
MSARRSLLVALAVLLLSGTACAGDPDIPTTGEAATTTSTPPGTSLRVEEVADGLEHGWDVGFLPGGGVLVTERPGRLVLVRDGTVTPVEADFSDVLVEGEGGLMGLVVHPDFERTRQFTTCQTHQRGGTAVDVRLVTWRLSDDERAATRTHDLLTGLPVNDSGRHSGCRPTFGPDGALLVGTGDSADDPTIPQDRTSLGGKVLRIDPDTGEGLPDNPFASSDDPNERRVYSYGHRNVQGVAVRPGTGRVYASEHGPTGFDEVNRIEAGGNYGWDPSQGGSTGSYDEDVPMTDLGRFPDAVPPLWTSGESSTEAPSGAAFVSGQEWGELNGMLAVVALRGQKMLLFDLDDAGTEITEVVLPPEFDDRFGRLRAVRRAPDDSLYVTTSDGADDAVFRVTPSEG